jgi:hypothetical protein
MASVATTIRKMLEAIALAVIVSVVLFFLREPMHVQFPLQVLARGPDLLLQRVFAQQWFLAAFVLRVGAWLARVAPDEPIAAVAAQSSGDWLQPVRPNFPIEPVPGGFDKASRGPGRTTPDDACNWAAGGGAANLALMTADVRARRSGIRAL